jgi:two-component system, chemotaxis family, sensor kinase CheA
MRALLSYLILPKRVTEFEARYLKRLNKIALIFFYLHIPAMALVAAICKTGPMRALLFTSVLLIGPTIAYFNFKNARRLSLVFGFTAMCMGGLLVHFGKGAMQIEMHFYFFVLIALLAVFANPLAIISAAVTVALHHLVLFIALPTSVFNYEASYWAVAVHALFVVLESVAACFVARSFFDNVIGLERIVQARTRDLQLLLDNVGQGFVALNPDGTLSSQRSVMVDEWLGAHRAERPLWDYFAGLDAGAAEWLKVGWEEVWADVMPLELTLEQLPRELRAGARVFRLDYKPIHVEGKLSQVLLVMSDVTSQRESERAQEAHRELMEVFTRVVRDRRGFLAFCDETHAAIEHLTSDQPTSLDDVWRDIHTLKGNAAIFGLAGLATLCHDLESAMQEEHRVLSSHEGERLRAEWKSITSRLEPVIGERNASKLEITEKDHRDILQAIDSGTSRATLARTVRSWKYEPTAQRLQRMAMAARALAKRLSKGEISVVIEPNNMRLFERTWSPFWSAFSHLIRNAVDHGLESPEDRRAAGKPDAGTLRLRTEVVDQRFIVEISDDGRGIDWQRLADSARRAGLPAETREHLMAALFATGITTKEVANEYSGRGIGLGAAKASCERLGGTMRVESTEGRGTRFEMSWPASILMEEPLAAAA